MDERLRRLERRAHYGDIHDVRSFLVTAYRASLFREPRRDEIQEILNVQLRQQANYLFDLRAEPYHDTGCSWDRCLNDSGLVHPEEWDNWAGGLCSWDECLQIANPG